MQTLTLLVLLFWVAVLATTLLNLALLPRLRPGAPTTGPLVSVLVPARNEERAVEQTIRAFLAQRYRNLEIVVVDDRSTDRTGAILRDLAGGDPRLVVVEGEEPPSGWLGKPWALHQAARRARGELLLFADADVRYGPEAVAAAVQQLAASDAALLALIPEYEAASLWEHVAMPFLTLSLLCFGPTALGNFTTSPLVPAIGSGAGNLVRRRDYDAIGGHEALRAAVVDDLDLAARLRRSGRPTRAALARGMVSLRMYQGARELADGFTKNLFARFGRSYAASLAMIPTGIPSVLPYALAFTGDAASLASVGLVTLVRILALGGRARWDNLLLGHPFMTLFWIGLMLRSMWVTGVRGRVLWRGREYAAGGEPPGPLPGAAA